MLRELEKLQCSQKHRTHAGALFLVSAARFATESKALWQQSEAPVLPARSGFPPSQARGSWLTVGSGRCGKAASRRGEVGRAAACFAAPLKAGDKGCSPAIAAMAHSLLPPVGQLSANYGGGGGVSGGKILFVCQLPHLWDHIWQLSPTGDNSPGKSYPSSGLCGNTPKLRDFCKVTHSQEWGKVEAWGYGELCECL